MRPQNVGILGLQCYIPKKYVEQSELEIYDNVTPGKYTIGLGQLEMSVCDDTEDINSMCLTVVQSLLDSYKVPPESIGRLEVGTETIIDKAKSVKTTLMQLFSKCGNYNIQGVDNINACYGGTNALFNAVNWVESSGWDNRLAIVVMADIAVYAKGPARPTGGAAAVALLIGPNSPIVLESSLTTTYMEHAYDFYKPQLASEYPVVDGALSNLCYLKALDITYQEYVKKLATVHQINPRVEELDHVIFHSPYTKQVTKAFARLYLIDYINGRDTIKSKALADYSDLDSASLLSRKDVERHAVEITADLFKQKTASSLEAARRIGNSYCASLYMCLASLLDSADSGQLMDKRIVLFSYGSGMTASMFSFKIRGDVSAIQQKLELGRKLNDRTKISTEQYDELMRQREACYNASDYRPTSKVNERNNVDGSFYLVRVDKQFKRFYDRFKLQ